MIDVCILADTKTDTDSYHVGRMELAYRAIPVDISAGINSNLTFSDFAKITKFPPSSMPMVPDGKPILFESGAILVYLAGKTNQFWDGLIARNTNVYSG